MEIKKDELLILSSGEYDDYNNMGIYKACEDIDIELIKLEYIKKYPNQKKKHNFVLSDFMNFLINELKIINIVPYKEWNLSQYGEINNMYIMR